MSKPAVPPPEVKSDEDEVFELFGIDEDDDKHRVKVLAAARVLASRKNKPPAPAPKKKSGRWGEE